MRSGSGQKHLGRGGMGIFFQEMVLDLPDVVEAEPVGQLDLIERVLEQFQLQPFGPRPWELMLVEDPELHGVKLPRPAFVCPELAASLRCAGAERLSGPRRAGC